MTRTLSAGVRAWAWGARPVVAAALALSLALAPDTAGRAAAQQSAAAAALDTAPDSPAGGSTVDSLEAIGRLQEAAWVARAAGDTARGEAILTRLDSILRRTPRSIHPIGPDSQGVSYSFRLDHGDGVESLFKVDGSDIFCRSCGADREVGVYRVDRLLGFDLAPMTVLQTVEYEGESLRGSAMYFIHDAVRAGQTDASKPDALRFLDAVVANTDRHNNNWLVVAGGRVVAIDHNRAFEFHPATRPKTCWETEIDAIEAPAELGLPFRRYRDLPVDSLAAALRGVVDSTLVRPFVERREAVVDRVLRRIREPGREIPREECTDDG